MENLMTINMNDINKKINFLKDKLLKIKSLQDELNNIEAETLAKISTLENVQKDLLSLQNILREPEDIQLIDKETEKAYLVNNENTSSKIEVDESNLKKAVVLPVINTNDRESVNTKSKDDDDEETIDLSSLSKDFPKDLPIKEIKDGENIDWKQVLMELFLVNNVLSLPRIKKLINLSSVYKYEKYEIDIIKALNSLISSGKVIDLGNFKYRIKK